LKQATTRINQLIAFGRHAAETGVNGKAKLLRKNKMDAIHRPLGSVHLFDSGVKLCALIGLVKEKLPLE
jgi:hypothetical protein